MKRAALINDLSGIGRCSITVALPIMSALGYECAVLPTAILSNHTAFDKFTFVDFTDNMHEYMDCWQALDARFDVVYSGFLGSEHQIDITLEFMSRFGKDALKVVDPVMGDDGKIYSTCTDALLSHMRRLVKNADVITPNLTELCVLCGEKYPQNITLDGVADLCKRLYEKGPYDIVVTGLESSVVSDCPQNKISNLVFENGKSVLVSNEKVPFLYCGTGDVFASVLCGVLANTGSLVKSVKTAADFVETCTKSTYENGGQKLFGIQFEDKMHILTELCK